MVGVAVMCILCGGVVLSLGTAQKSFRRSEISNTLDQQLRAAQELMSQDVSQAGLTGTGYTSSTQYMSLTGNDNPTALATLSAAVTSSTTTATVSTTSGMFAGQRVFVGTGSSQESIYISAVSSSSSSITTTFGNSHSSGDPIFPHGVFADGVVPATETTGPSTASTLHIYGDLAGNGMITVVDYVCPTSTTTPSYTDSSGTVWAPLLRYEYDDALGTSTVTTMKVLNMVAVTSGGCFLYTPATATVNGTTWTFVIDVSVSIRAMAGVLSNDGTTLSPLIDPDTHQPVTVTRSFLNIQPRNILASYRFANYCSTNSLTDGEIMAMPSAIQSMIGAIP
jgi:Tfp pilus assembly protein PilW